MKMKNLFTSNKSFEASALLRIGSLLCSLREILKLKHALLQMCVNDVNLDFLSSFIIKKSLQIRLKLLNNLRILKSQVKKYSKSQEDLELDLVSDIFYLRNELLHVWFFLRLIKPEDLYCLSCKLAQFEQFKVDY